MDDEIDANENEANEMAAYDEKLATLGAQAREAHGELTRYGRMTVTAAIRLGNICLAAKQMIGHGHFGKWLKLTIPNCSQDSIGRYMTLAKASLENPQIAENGLCEALEEIKQAKETKDQPDEEPHNAEPEGLDEDEEEEEEEEEDEDEEEPPAPTKPPPTPGSSTRPD